MNIRQALDQLRRMTERWSVSVHPMQRIDARELRDELNEIEAHLQEKREDAKNRN